MDWKNAAVILVFLIQGINKCQGLSGAAVSKSINPSVKSEQFYLGQSEMQGQGWGSWCCSFQLKDISVPAAKLLLN